MSTISLSAAIASLKPGISTSPDDALKAWTVIKGFSDNTLSFIDRSYLWVAGATFLIAYAVFATLIRARLSSIQTQLDQSSVPKLIFNFYMSSLSAACMTALLISSAYGLSNLHVGRNVVFKGLQSLSYLHPKIATSSVLSLTSWVLVKNTIEQIKLIHFPKKFLMMGAWTAATWGVTSIAMHSQAKMEIDDPNSKVKEWIDITTIGSLVLANLVFITGYLYSKNLSLPQ